jgi:bifunctional non-homologous end joining protein LigD
MAAAGNETYSDKRSFEDTPEPSAAGGANVDLARARPGTSFVIHQHHARRLHFDLRLEMLADSRPVLASWAIPKGLPLGDHRPRLAVHVEDHPIEYGSFSGTIPKGNYGAGEVRIFDSGSFELLEQAEGKLSFRLRGGRIQGVFHLARGESGDGSDQWFATLKEDERPPADPPPALDPMLATPRADAFDGREWMFEPKWDGVRTLAVCRDETHLLSRRKRDVTETYPELASLHERLVTTEAVVDGEIVAFEEGRPSFERLQSRINLQNPHDIARAQKAIPVTFIAFDLLYLDRRTTVELPLEDRKRLLEELVVPSELVRISSPCVVGEGLALSDAARARRLEGIVAKRLGSSYRPGRRTKDWLKIKVVHDADVVVGGWSPGEGSRSDAFGSLLVGAYDSGALRFLGAVGTGFDRRTLDDVLAQLQPLRSTNCPFAEDFGDLRAGGFGKALRDLRWVEPDLVCRVEFRELTAGLRLRAPSFKGLRSDKLPRDCTVDDVRAAAGQAKP